MKKVLILVLSSQEYPYRKMLDTSLATWDSIEVEGVESVFYLGLPLQENTDKIIYLPIPEGYITLGRKTLMAFEWALENRGFDYLVRVNASTYVNKKELIKYVQTLPDNDVFAGLEVLASEGHQRWLWGPVITFSKDVVQKLVDNKYYLDETLMEDMGISYLANKLEIPYMKGRACTIDKIEGGWRCLCYGSESREFTDFADLKKNDGQFFYRVKCDWDRDMDEYLMYKLFNNLK